MLDVQQRVQQGRLSPAELPRFHILLERMCRGLSEINTAAVLILGRPWVTATGFFASDLFHALHSELRVRLSPGNLSPWPIGQGSTAERSLIHLFGKGTVYGSASRLG